MSLAYFEVSSDNLGPDDRHDLRKVADCLKDGPLAGAIVSVVGHTDPRGSEGSNDQLGEDRADAVEAYLIQSGVDPTHLTSDSMGEMNASEDPDDWPADRRVDLILRDSPAETP